MKISAFLCACVPPLLLITVLTGQEKPQVTFRTSAQEVNLDLIIRDNRGRQVKNLRPDEVEIFENGVRQDIKSLRLVSGKEVQQRAAGSTLNRARVAEPRHDNPLPAVNYICIVYHNVDERTRKYAIEATRKFLDRELQPGTGVALFSLGARLTPLNEFTTDRKKLMEFAAKSSGPVPSMMRVSEAALNATPYQASVSVTETGETSLTFSGGQVDPRSINGAEVATSMGADTRRGLAADQRRAFGHIVGMQGQDQMNLMLDEIGPLPGRKTILLLSSGLATTGDLDQFKRLTERANQAQITIYAVDVNGMGDNSNVVAGNTQLRHVAGLSRSQTAISNSAGAAAEKSRQGDYIEMAVRTTNTRAPLRELSESTGGFLIADTEDLRKPFQHLQEDIDTHYEAVYTPTAKVYDGTFRKIEVKLARANLNVQNRVGYYALPALNGSQELMLADIMGLAALNTHQRPHPFDYRTGVFHFGATASGTQQALTFELPADALTATPLAAGRHRIHVSLLALVKDSNGQVVDVVRRDAPFDIAGENLAAVRTSTIPFAAVVDVPAGRYTVETAVLDREANRVSVADFHFESQRTKGLDLSSVILVEQLQALKTIADPADPFQFPGNGIQAGRVIPALSTALSAEAHPLVYFVIYPNASNPAKPQLQVDFLANGKVMATQLSDVPAPSSSGSIPMVIKAAAHPGNCELKITAIQGSESTAHRLRYSMAAK